MKTKLNGYKTLTQIAEKKGITRQGVNRRWSTGDIVKLGDEYFLTSDLQHHLIDIKKNWNA